VDPSRDVATTTAPRSRSASISASIEQKRCRCWVCAESVAVAARSYRDGVHVLPSQCSLCLGHPRPWLKDCRPHCYERRENGIVELGRWRWKLAAGAVAAALVTTGAVAAASGLGRSARHRTAAVQVVPPSVTAATTVAPTVARTPTTPLPTTRPAPSTTTLVPTTVPAGPPASATLAMAGCPVAPHPPITGPPPWHPAVLVPDASLPAVTAPHPWRSQMGAIGGTGMWIWQLNSTEGGQVPAIVKRAVEAHLHQLWVRVGDSKDGFYGASELDQVVPAAHAAGLAVIAWGFPYLYDPVADAHWTAQILAWRGPGGQAVDGYSADIEMATEGVDLTARRAQVYLQGVRQAAGGRLVVATVYPPIGSLWTGRYPFVAMAPYVDAFAPMIYWECSDPRSDAVLDIGRLSRLRPVHVIGQAFDMASTGGRTVAPSGAEITAFLSASRVAGAVGGSFWVWQHATAEEWAALAAYRWAA